MSSATPRVGLTAQNAIGYSARRTHEPVVTGMMRRGARQRLSAWALVGALSSAPWPAAHADPVTPSAHVVEGPSPTTEPQRATPTATASPRAAWIGPLPDPHRRFVPTGVLGALYAAYAALAVLAFLLAAPLAPWVCPIPRPPSQQGVAARVAMGAAVCATAAVGFLFARAFGLGGRVVTAEYEAFLRVADACAAGVGCPLAGNAVGASTAHLGPLYMLVLATCHRVTPDAGLVFDLFAAGHGVAAGLTLALGARRLGAPAGVIAGLLYATNPDLAFVYLHLSHAALAPLPAAGFAWALASLLTGGGARALVWSALCFACLVQAHAVTFALAPAVVALLAWARPSVSRRGWAAAALVVAVMYLPWSIYTLSNLADLTAGTAAVATPAPPSRFLEQLRPASLWLTILGVVSLLAGAARRDARPVDRHLAVGLVMLYGSGIALYAVATRQFWFRYVVLFFPYAPLVWAAGLTSVARMLPPRRGLREVVTVAVCALAAWAIVPLVRTQLAQRTNRTRVLEWREGAAVVRALERRGFRRRDLREHLHGPLLEDLMVPVERFRRDRATGARAPGEAVAWVGCRRVSPSFARWQETTSPLGRPLTIAGYQPQLSPLDVTLRGRDAREVTLPFRTDPDAGELVFLGSQMEPWLPGFRPPATFDPIHTAWQHALPSGELRVVLRGTLEAAPEDRVIVVKHSADESVRVTLDGAPRDADVTQRGYFTLAVTESFRVRAVERAAPRAVEITIDLRGGQFPRVPFDVYEEPFPACVDPPS